MFHRHTMNDQIEGGCKVNVSRIIEGDCTKNNENTLQLLDSNISTGQGGGGGGELICKRGRPITE